MKVRLFEIVSDEDKININKVVEVLSKDCIKDWAYILHDKDNTRSHIHIAVRLKDSYDTKYISSWFGIAENFVNKVKGRWSDMLKYLIHENAPEKYQYDESEVVSNFDWTKEKNKVNSNKRLEEIIESIVSGQIREYNYTDAITPIEDIRFSRAIDRAFKYRSDKIKGVERQMDCLFITGDSGVGKTTYAKIIAENKKYSLFVSSGSNDILDDYKGQDCIILDDLRPSSIGLADLLKMLDNNTASTVKSRYKNKVLECKMIIITTTLDINTFFKNVFADDLETSIQLKRRCETHIRMTSEKMYMRMWQRKSKVYSKEYEFDNPVINNYPISDLTEEQVLEKLSNILGGFKGMIDDVKKDINEYKQEEFEGMTELKDDKLNPFNK